jgi:ABC-type Fe3+ transport system permease subunit
VFIVCYSLTSFVGGYVSGGYNARAGGKQWIKTMALTAGLFPGCVFGIAFFLNAGTCRSCVSRIPPTVYLPLFDWSSVLLVMYVVLLVKFTCVLATVTNASQVPCSLPLVDCSTGTVYRRTRDCYEHGTTTHPTRN